SGGKNSSPVLGLTIGYVRLGRIPGESKGSAFHGPRGSESGFENPSADRGSLKLSFCSSNFCLFLELKITPFSFNRFRARKSRGYIMFSHLEWCRPFVSVLVLSLTPFSSNWPVYRR